MPTSLEYQLVDVKFTEGQDTKTQAKLRLPGKWDTLENVVLAKDNALTVRGGLQQLVGTTGNGLATNGTELLVVDGSTVSSVVLATAPDSVVTVPGQYANVDVAKQEVQRDTGQHNSPDCATGSGLSCYVWRAKDAIGGYLGINLKLVDETTAAEVVPTTLLTSSATAFCPRVVFASDRFYIFYQDGNNLLCRVILTSSPTTLGAQTAVVTSASLFARNYDAAPFQNTAIVAYAWNDGTTSVRAAQVFGGATPAVVSGPLNVISAGQLAAISLCGIAVAAYSNGTSYGVFTLGQGALAMAGTAGVVIDATTFTITAGPTRIDADTTSLTGESHITATPLGVNIQVFSDRQCAYNSSALSPIRTVTVSVALAIASAARTLLSSASFSNTPAAGAAAGPQGPWVFGKAFTVGARTFLPCCILEDYTNLGPTTSPVNLNTQSGAYVLDGSTGIVMARAIYGGFGVSRAVTLGTPPQISTPCSSPLAATDAFFTVMQEVTEFAIFGTTAGSAVKTQIGLSRLSMAPNSTLQPIQAQLGETTYLAGGALTAYDGSAVGELGFFQFPEGVGAVGANGGSMTTGTHLVTAVYEWTDAGGNIHVSAPAPPVSVTLSGAQGTILVNVPTLLLTQKTGVQIVVYCTAAAGLTFFRTNVTGAYPNTKAATTVLAAITTADASLTTNELLYSQPLQGGTALPNISPPPVSALAVHDGRLFIVVADQPGTVDFSQPFVDGVGLQFSDEAAMQFTTDVNGGQVIALASMDEKLAVLCERRPYALLGTGPTLAGLSGQYTLVEVPSDVGCRASRSVLRMPSGIIFKSPKGWYLLGRDLQVKYIGEGVSRFDAQSVSGAVMLENEQECRFSSVDGTQLVFSYLSGQWSVLTYDFDGAELDARASIWWPTDASWVVLSPTVGLATETTEGADGSFAITPIMRTGWLRVNSLDGFQRVRWLYWTMTANGLPLDPGSSLEVSVDFDDEYGNTAAGSYTFPVDLNAISFTSTQAIDLRHKLRRQKCKSVAFTFIVRTLPPFANRLTGFQALTLQVGVKHGTNKLPAGQSVG